MTKLEKFYNGKRVLVTGHTGFKGSWLTKWLLDLGAEVYGISKGIPTKTSNYKILKLKSQINESLINICDNSKLRLVCRKFQPDIIFHLAAQSLVRESILNPLETFKTNLIGTSNVLEVAKDYDKKLTIILITSDKVYHNNEWDWGYRENDNLGGKDPYSLSKMMAEYSINNYYDLFLKKKSNIRIGICRAGNVIGGGDWAKDRIIPDCFRAWSKKSIIKIRNPNSTRPWQHVLEPLSGYLYFALKLNRNPKLNGEPLNFGPNSNNNLSVLDLLNKLKYLDKNFKFKIIESKNDNESKLLKLNCEKALQLLNWESILSFNKTVELTYSWYNEFYNNSSSNIINFTSKQIKEYHIYAKKKNIEWAG